MIDIHSHILYGVDDGPDTLEESIEMVKLAISEGISHIIATPHYRLPNFDNSKTLDAFNRLQEVIQSEQLDIEMSLGNELYLDDEMLAALDSQSCLSLADSTYLLIELPEYKLYPFHEQLLYEIQIRGYRAILTHIERYDYLMNDLNLLGEMIRRGCYTQMNSAAVLEKSTRKRAFDLIRRGFVHFMATDCHSIGKRIPNFNKAYQLVEARIGADKAKKLFYDNGYYILNNEPLRIERVTQYPKRVWNNKFLGGLGCLR